VTTFRVYHGTHRGTFLGVAATGRKIHFETVDAMRVHDGKITEHWGVANLFSLMQQLGAWPPDHPPSLYGHDIRPTFFIPGQNWSVKGVTYAQRSNLLSQSPLNQTPAEIQTLLL
jgi:hypothetical protein